MKQIKWLQKPWDPSQEVFHSYIIADQSHFQTPVELTDHKWEEWEADYASKEETTARRGYTDEVWMMCVQIPLWQKLQHESKEDRFVLTHSS